MRNLNRLIVPFYFVKSYKLQTYEDVVLHQIENSHKKVIYARGQMIFPKKNRKYYMLTVEKSNIVQSNIYKISCT